MEIAPHVLRRPHQAEAAGVPTSSSPPAALTSRRSGWRMVRHAWLVKRFPGFHRSACADGRSHKAPTHGHQPGRASGPPATGPPRWGARGCSARWRGAARGFLARAAADEGACGDAVQRAERMVHAVLECLYAVHSLTEEQALNLHPRYEELEAALVALLRRPPCSAVDLNAYRAACMLRSFDEWTELQPDGLIGARTIAVMGAVVAAIPSASSWRGDKETGCDNMNLYCAMLEGCAALDVARHESQQHGAFRTAFCLLLMAQPPGALAALLQRVREMVASNDRYLVVLAAVCGTIQLQDSHASASELFCQSALLDAELSLSEVLSPEFTRVHDEARGFYRELSRIRQRFVTACTGVTAIQLLRHPPDGAAFAAAAAAALLASHSDDVAALLPLGTRLETLTRAHARAGTRRSGCGGTTRGCALPSPPPPRSLACTRPPTPPWRQRRQSAPPSARAPAC